MNKKKVFSIIGTVLTGLIVVLTVYIIISIVIANVQDEDVNLFGYSFGIVQTDSMEPEICVGDLIIFNHGNIDEVEVGDNIVFVAGSEFGVLQGENIVHKVIIIENDGGGILIYTQGVNRTTLDPNPVTSENFVGECTYHSSAWGGFFSFMRSYGIMVLIAVIAVPFIIRQIIKIVKLSREQGGEQSSGPDDTDEDQ